MDHPGAPPGVGIPTNRIEGIAAFFKAAEGTAGFTGGSLVFEPQEILIDGDRATVVSRNTAKRDDRRLDIEMIFLCRVVGGKVVEVTEFPQRPQDWIDFWK